MNIKAASIDELTKEVDERIEELEDKYEELQERLLALPPAAASSRHSATATALFSGMYPTKK